MVNRRVLLPMLVAAFVLLGSGQALAAPTWLGGESQDGAEAVQSVPVDVATDSGGNSMAVWVASTESGGEVRAAYRPHGGPWGAPESLDQLNVLSDQPRAAVQPDGEFIAVWLASGDGNLVRWASHPAGGGWSGAKTMGTISCCPGVAALLASADGTVTAIATDEGTPNSFTKEPGSDTFGPREQGPPGQGNVFAAAADGSVIAVRDGFCETGCILARRRPPGGPWPETDEVVANVPSTQTVNGLAVTANPDASYTAVWAEAAAGESPPSGQVLSSDRGKGDAGTWAASRLVADVPGVRPGCNGCVDVSTGASGAQLALWKQGGVMSAALRGGGAGSAWGAPETAGEAPSNSQPFGAITTGGVPVAAWDSGFTAGAATGTHREGGAWQPVELAGGRARGGFPAGTTFLGDLAADGQGDALTAWRDDNGVQTAGFDATGPRFTAFSLPVGGSAGGALPFTAAADDNWSGPPTISWSFGDGGTASGGSVSHTYAAGGSYVVTASAADGAGNVAGGGNVTQQSGSVGVAPAAPTCGTGDADKDGVKDGCDDSNGALRPKPFKTVNATVVSGDVFVKLPAGAARVSAARKAPKGFKRLEGAETIPVGSTLDTAHGRVKVRSAADIKAKKLQSGQFFRGRFSIRQARIKKRSKKLITELRLTGSSFKRACKAKASISKRKKSRRRVRRLFGSAKGSFRTSGRNAAATVRGTRWSVQDRCDGTLVTVQRGRVEVRDKVKRKTVIVRTGHKYLARSR